MALFMRYCPLPEQFLSIKTQITKAEEIIAKGLPNKIVYSESEINSFEGYPHVINALIELGILKLQERNIDIETGFIENDGWEDDKSIYTKDKRWVVTGALIKLIDDIKGQHDSHCFISFYADEGIGYANQLKMNLDAAGIDAFICSEQSTGTSWKNNILTTLRNATIMILVETQNYHTRPTCQIERDLAIAKGLHLLRVGLCDLNKLNGIPPWMNDIQYENFNINGIFNPEQSLFGLPLPDKIDIHIRKQAALTLIEKVTPDNVYKLASKLSLADQLTGSDHNKKTQLVNLAFQNITKAEQFCLVINFDDLF